MLQGMAELSSLEVKRPKPQQQQNDEEKAGASSQRYYKEKSVGLGDLQVVVSEWKAGLRTDCRVTGLCSWIGAG